MDIATILSWQARTQVISNFKFEAAVLTNLFGSKALQSQIEGTTAKWDIRVPSRKAGVYNAPDARAQTRALTVLRSDSSGMLRKYDERRLPGSVLRQIRAPGSDARQRMGRERVTSEQREMAEEITRSVELSISKMLTPNTQTFTIANGQQTSTVTVDPAIPVANHDLAGGSLTIANWGTVSTDILGDIETMKIALQDSSGYLPELVVCRSAIRGYLMKNTNVVNLLGGTAAAAQLLNTGDIARFMGMDWVFYDGSYVNESGAVTRFLADDTLIMTAKPEKSWWEVQMGSEPVANADLTDLVEAFGLSAWTRIRDNPSGISLFALQNWLPTPLVPGAIVHVVVT